MVDCYGTWNLSYHAMLTSLTLVPMNVSSRITPSFLLFLASPVCAKMTCWVLCKGVNIFLSFKHVKKNTGSTIF